MAMASDDQILELFCLADTNGDGFISIKELEAFMKKMGQSLTFRELRVSLIFSSFTHNC